MAEGGEIIVYECPECWAILPYKSCSHSCPGQDGQDEEGFVDDISTWYEEVKAKKEQGVRVRVIDGDGEEYNLEEQIVILLPNQPGRQYQEDIRGPDLEGSYHLRRLGEKVPDGVEPIQMVEVRPGEYRRLEQVEQVELEMSMARVSLDEVEEQPNFDDLREPYP